MFNHVTTESQPSSVLYPPCRWCTIQRRSVPRSLSSGCRSDSSRLRSRCPSRVEPTRIDGAPPVAPPDNLLLLQTNIETRSEVFTSNRKRKEWRPSSAQPRHAEEAMVLRDRQQLKIDYSSILKRSKRRKQKLF